MNLTLRAAAVIAGLLLVAAPASAQTISRGLGLGLTLVGGAGGPPLDLIVSTPASAAYSFRKLRPAYAGAAVRLRRVDLAEQDIGFTTGGDFDTTTANTFCAATSCFIRIWYDQSGLGRDAVQATPANQPAMIFNCNGALPCMQTTTAQNVASVSAGLVPVLPTSFSAVANRNAGTGSCSWPAQFGANYLRSTGGTANQWEVYGSLTLTGAAADNAWHAGVGVISGASSVLRIDAAESTGFVTGLTAAGQFVAFWGAASTTCSATEVIVWDGYALTATERANLTANQRAYWMPSPATSGFAGFAPSVRNVGNAGAASIFLTPIIAQQSGTATAVLLDAIVGGATNFKALIYDGAHSALLATGTTVASVAIDYNRFPLVTPLAVVAGTTYYVGYAASAAFSTTIQSAGGSSWWASGGQNVTTPANPLSSGASNAGSLMVALEMDGSTSSGMGFSPDQASGVTLSAANSVATFPASANRGARSVVTRAPGSGKWYAEVLIGGTVDATSGIGIATASYGLTQGVGSVAYVSLLKPGGFVQTYGSTVSNSLSYVAGDVIGIAYDAVNNSMWFNKNNGNWFGASTSAGDPVANTGGVSVETTQWPLSVTVATTAASAEVFTLRDYSGLQQYAPPAGFAAWAGS